MEADIFANNVCIRDTCKLACEGIWSSEDVGSILFDLLVPLNWPLASTRGICYILCQTSHNVSAAIMGNIRDRVTGNQCVPGDGMRAILVRAGWST